MELDFFLIFNIAFSASLGHCIGMCGGIVLAINSKIAQNGFSPILSNILYNLGRISSYLFIGALCGGAGKVFEINPYTKGGALIFIGLTTFGFGALMLFAPKMLSKIEPTLSESRGFRAFFAKIYASKNLGSFYVLGLLNGLLPCGIVYYFALIALASGGVWKGMGVMGVFGVATLVPMLLAGILANLLLTSRFKQIMLKISAIVMMIFGIYTIYKGIKLF